ncbi:hypothetical protein EBB07_28300 [Paenibacillaceae bacterium]|nr:hypothetical protein EBB07_28300 [Paenibacillaceae bacterium]
MKNNKIRSNNGVGFTGMLAIVFIALKISGYILWSWWWVLSPIWINVLIVMLVMIFALAFSIGLKNDDK